jgi:hypothetical protein
MDPSLVLNCEDDRPLGTCEFCGDDYYDVQEESVHAGGDCIGGSERFDTTEEERDEW